MAVGTGVRSVPRTSQPVVPAPGSRTSKGPGLSSWPGTRKAPAEPSTRVRGPGAPTRLAAHRWLIVPEAWSRARKTSSSVGVVRARSSARTPVTGPKSCIAASTRCGPRSSSSPPPAPTAFSRHRFLGTGRQRSQRRSNRCTSPSWPSASTRARVSCSASQRRFWKTVSGVPVVSARAATAAAPAWSRASGLSTTTGIPASRPASACSTCRPVGEATTSTSGREASSSAVRSGCTDTPGQSASASARRPGSVVTTSVTRQPASRSSGVWNCRPAMPYPTSPAVSVRPVWCGAMPSR
ncbi:hypothetical protein BJF77_05275 [Kocuria sp. CNJ-770]|nr:hypothetical protein BJF77_05275 [Kocuria sp. CNJ-770]